MLTSSFCYPAHTFWITPSPLPYCFTSPKSVSGLGILPGFFWQTLRQDMLPTSCKWFFPDLHSLCQPCHRQIPLNLLFMLWGPRVSFSGFFVFVESLDVYLDSWLWVAPILNSFHLFISLKIQPGPNQEELIWSCSFFTALNCYTFQFYLELGWPSLWCQAAWWSQM